MFPDLDRFAGPVATDESCDILSEAVYVKPGEPRRSAWFGATVAAGHDMFVATAPLETDSLSQIGDLLDPSEPCPERHPPERPSAGVVRVYQRTGGSWIDQKLEIEGAERIQSILPSDQLTGPYEHGNYSACSLAASERRIVLGAGGDGRVPGGAHRGSVRLYERIEEEWKAKGFKIEEPATVDGDAFGRSVALLDDTLVVGAPGEDVGFPGADSGAAYVYELSGDRYLRQGDPLLPNASQQSAWFGWSVAISPDWVAVGAPGEDIIREDGFEQRDGGAVYMYSRHGEKPERLIPSADLSDPRSFGETVALAGDTLAVGAPAATGCQSGINRPFRGAVQLYSRVSGEWQRTRCVDAADGRASFFGWQLALTPQALVVGAPYSGGYGVGMNPPIVGDAPGVPYDSTGSVYIFPASASTSGYREHACHLKAPNPGACDGFGESVATTSDLLVVGAPFEDSETRGIGPAASDNALMDSGASYVYSWTAR